MAEVHLSIAGRSYAVSCRDGEEEDLHKLAAMVDEQAQAAGSAIGGLTESRQLLFASLFLADKLAEAQKLGGNALNPEPQSSQFQQSSSLEDERTAEILEKLAERLEEIADRLET